MPWSLFSRSSDLSHVRFDTRLRWVLALVVAVTLGAGLLHAFILVHAVDESVIEAFRRESTTLLGNSIRQSLPDRFFERLKRVEARGDAAQELFSSLSPYDVSKMRAYGPDGELLWPSQDGTMERKVSDNEDLTRALAGELVGRLGDARSGGGAGSAGGSLLMSEVYVPVHAGAAARVVGVVELHRPLRALQDGRRRTSGMLWLGAIIATVVLCVVLSLIFRVSYNRLFRMEGEVSQEKAKLESVVGGIGAGLCLVDEDRSILWSNKIFSDWFSEDGAVVGKKCNELCWMQKEACNDCGSDQIVARTRVMPGGKEHHYQVLSWPVKDPSGATGRKLELIQDVTEGIEMQHQLLQAGKLAAVGELAGFVAHEINNPVGVILANATHLLRHSESGDRETLEMVRSNAARIGEITSGLLKFARLSPGERELISLNEVIKESLGLVGHRMKPSGIQSVTTMTENDLPIMGNFNELEQVCVNLLNNALDAMPEGGSLEVRTSSNGSSSILEIQDTGEGILPEHLDQVFDVFFTTKGSGKGTGLGLTISDRIVASHGGKMLVRSTRGEGTCFTIILPMERAQS